MTDLEIAKKYTVKFNNARQLKHEFDLSFNDFKRLMNRQKCEYSGLTLIDEKEKFCSRTVDRIDNSIGYIKGNVRVVAYGINALKATIENPQHEMTNDILVKIAKKFHKDMK